LLAQQLVQVAEPAPEDIFDQPQTNDDDRLSERSGRPRQHTPTVAGAEEARLEAQAPSDLASALRLARELDRAKGKALIHQIVSRLGLFGVHPFAYITCPLDIMGYINRCSNTPSEGHCVPKHFCKRCSVTGDSQLIDLRRRHSSKQLQLTQLSLHRCIECSTPLLLYRKSYLICRRQVMYICLSRRFSHACVLQSMLRTDGTTSFMRPPKRIKTSHAMNECDHTSQLRALSADASTFEAMYHPHLIQTLAKWSAKIQAVNPTVLLSTSHAIFKSSLRNTQTPLSPGIVDVIDASLSSDAPKLLTRSRTQSGGSTGDSSNEAGNTDDDDPDVFDDIDFYQQLLRDVIHSHGVNENIFEQDWVQRQKARKMKKKKTVDTKASKGRKLRYQIHEKLQNFMVPISISCGGWHEDQIDELFASLPRS
jgi:hypothetical protein